MLKREQLGQDSQDRTVRIRRQGHDSLDGIAKAGKRGYRSQNRTSSLGIGKIPEIIILLEVF
jgi:hypothetical protein